MCRVGNLLGDLGDVRTPRIGKLEARRWMQEIRSLAEAKDAELFKTVELVKELEVRFMVPPEQRLAA